MNRKVHESRGSFNNIITVFTGKFLEDATRYLYVVTFYTVIYSYLKGMLSFYTTYSLYSLIFAVVACDFIFYIYHRFHHSTPLLWAFHFVHHGDTQYNLTTSLRSSWGQIIYTFLFYLPLLFIGFTPGHIIFGIIIGRLWQFFVHTQLIPKLPRPIEYIFVTPSNHRVHHGQNTKYLNKNFGGVFIIWDRIFKTYEEEADSVVFGIKDYREQNFIRYQIDPLINYSKILKERVKHLISEFKKILPVWKTKEIYAANFFSLPLFLLALWFNYSAEKMNLAIPTQIKIDDFLFQKVVYANTEDFLKVLMFATFFITLAIFIFKPRLISFYLWSASALFFLQGIFIGLTYLGTISEHSSSILTPEGFIIKQIGAVTLLVFIFGEEKHIRKIYSTLLFAITLALVINHSYHSIYILTIPFLSFCCFSFMKKIKTRRNDVVV